MLRDSPVLVHFLSTLLCGVSGSNRHERIQVEVTTCVDTGTGFSFFFFLGDYQVLLLLAPSRSRISLLRQNAWTSGNLAKWVRCLLFRGFLHSLQMNLFWKWHRLESFRVEGLLVSTYLTFVLVYEIRCLTLYTGCPGSFPPDCGRDRDRNRE